MLFLTTKLKKVWERLSLQELADQRDLIHKTAEAMFAETGTTFQYKVGTMIEIPRAALVADEVSNKPCSFLFHKHEN
jgi:pyruvate,orthophosphate dikinase